MPGGFTMGPSTDDPPDTDTEWRSWAADMEIRMGRVEDDLRTNNLQTQEIHEVITSAQGFFRVLGHIGTGAAWIGKVVGAAAAIWAIVTAIATGKPPSL